MDNGESLPARVVFRPAVAADASAVSEVYLASRKTFLPYAPLAHTDEEVRQWIAGILIAGGQVSAAVLEGEVVGMMALSREEGIGWIDQLYLHPRAVGLGLGAQFVAQAKAALGSPIRLYTFQANAGARRFYERHGFRAVEFGDGSGNEEQCPDVLYEWR